MEALKKAEKDHKISQDEHRQKSDEVQKLTDRYVKQVDEVLAQQGKRDQDGLMPTASLPANADPTPGPSHVAIIMDGNGRWAKARGLPRVAGHRRGADAVRRVVRGAGELGIPVLTLFAFSTENWTRPADEVNDLMGLLRHYLRNELDELRKNGARLRVIGNREGLASDIVRRHRRRRERRRAATAASTSISASTTAHVTRSCRRPVASPAGRGR